MRYLLSLVLMSCVIGLVGCTTTPPTSAITEAPENDINLVEVLSDSKLYQGAPVRWGGRIVKVQEIEREHDNDNPQWLQVEVLEFPLNDKGQPLPTEASSGRFMALIKSPYKASAYYRNRYVTLTGIISGEEVRSLANGKQQVLPIIEVQEQYRWQSAGDSPNVWSRFFYSIGISNDGVGFGVIFH